MSVTEATLATMQVHTLEPERFDLLAQAPDGIVPDPRFITAIVAEQDGKLLGRWFLCLVPHYEGMWLDDAARNTTVGFRIVREMEARAREMGIQRTFVFAQPEHEDYMQRLGFERQPFSVWSKDLPCQSQQ